MNISTLNLVIVLIILTDPTAAAISDNVTEISEAIGDNDRIKLRLDWEVCTRCKFCL
jgi:hypothetical protein